MLIRDVTQLHLLEEFLLKNHTIAYDIETTGLNPRLDDIIGFGISNSDEGIYLVHKEWNGHELVEVIPKEECHRILNIIKDRKLITWNGSFDTRFTKHYFNIDLINSLWCDAMLTKHTVDEDQPFKLKEVASKIFGEDAKEEQKLMKESIKSNGGSASEMYKANTSLMGKYCIKDCILTYRLNDHYLSKVYKEELENFYFDEEVMPTYKMVTIPMEDRGIQLDMDLLGKASKEISRDIEELEDKIQGLIKPHLTKFEKWFLWKDYPPRRSGEFAQYIAQHGNLDLPKTGGGKFSLSTKALQELPNSIYKTFLLGGEYLPGTIVREIQLQMFEDNKKSKHMFNLQSKHHLKKLFFDTFGEEPITRTELGSPQCNEDFIQHVKDKYEFAPDLLVFNKLIKLKSSYIDRFSENNLNGIYYPSFFQHRTTSGRFGSDIQQLPRQFESPDGINPLIYKYNNVIRDLIISRPGRELVGADYSSLEVVVFADDAGDEVLINMIKNKEDFYSRVAIDVQGFTEYSADKGSDKYLKKHLPEVRQDSKVYSLGIRYGMQEFKLSKTLGISKRDAGSIIKGYFQKYPKLATRMKDLRDQALIHGCVKSKAGRVRHLPLAKVLYRKHGSVLMDSLKLWEKYHDSRRKYEEMKKVSKRFNADMNNCLNFPIQSMAASIVNRASIEIMREFKARDIDACIIMSIHDEIVVECKKEDSLIVSKIMQDKMENTTKLAAPLEAIPEIGVRYGDIK